ncbi:hypothetical protein ACFLVF_02515 [Chloroflexota bacterium]
MAQEPDSDYHIIKYNASGDMLWSVSYDGGLWDYAYKVAVDRQNDIVVTGMSEIWHDYNENGEQDEGEINHDYYTVKYNADGVEQWHALYDSKGRDEAFAVTVDSKGNVIVGGRSHNGNDYDYSIIKYNPQGTELWAEPLIYDGGDNDGVNSVAVDSQDNIIVTGYSTRRTLAYCTIKYSPEGGIIDGWPVFFDREFSDAALEVVVEGGSDSILVTGTVGIWHDGDADGDQDREEMTSDFLTIKYSHLGHEVWAEPLMHNIGPNRTSDTAFGLALNGNGDVIVTGSYFTLAKDEVFPKWFLYATLKYDTDGNLIEGWPVIYDSGNGEQVYDVAVDLRDDSIIVTGKAFDGKTWNYYTIKYRSNGEEQWHSTYDAGQWDSAKSVAVDSEGNITVAGSSQEPHDSTVPKAAIEYNPSSFTFSAIEGAESPAGQLLYVWNSGGDVLNWSIDGSVPWLVLDPTRGSSTGERNMVGISVDISGMSAGDYTTTIAVATRESPDVIKEIPIQLYISALQNDNNDTLGSITGIFLGSLAIAGVTIIFFARKRLRRNRDSSV